MLKNFTSFIVEKKRTLEELSGIALIMDNEYLLLVKPKKYKGLDYSWSIPKGHKEIELTYLQNALKELQEETGIKLPEKYIDKNNNINLIYEKENAYKSLIIYIVNINMNDLINLNITIDENNNVNNNFIANSNEIHKCRFFSLDNAEEKIEFFFLPLIKKLKKEKPKEIIKIEKPASIYN